MPTIKLFPLAWQGRNTPNYFHPSIAPLPDGRWLMTLQSIMGSDFFGSLEYTISGDRGQSWSEVIPAPPFATCSLTEKLEEGFADIRLFALSDGTILAIGCNAFYTPKGNLCWNADEKIEYPPEYPVYAFFRDGTWSERHILKAACFENQSWRVACAQLVLLPGDTLLIPVYFGTGHFAVCTVRAAYTGDELVVMERGNILENPAGRGFVEPSVVKHGGSFFLTLRAEDEHGYRCRSNDGLEWGAPVPWCWEDGEELVMSSTQQHWLPLGGKLYLVYTRKTPENANIMRYRAPLFMAEFDPARGALLRDTERIVFPQRCKNGVENRLGNFHVAVLSDECALVSDCDYYGNNCGNDRDELFTELEIAEITEQAGK